MARSILHFSLYSEDVTLLRADILPWHIGHQNWWSSAKAQPLFLPAPWSGSDNDTGFVGYQSFSLHPHCSSEHGCGSRLFRCRNTGTDLCHWTSVTYVHCTDSSAEESLLKWYLNFMCSIYSTLTSSRGEHGIHVLSWQYSLRNSYSATFCFLLSYSIGNFPRQNLLEFNC